MSSDLPRLYLARHGDTAWTKSHQVVAGLRRAGFAGGRSERGDALRLRQSLEDMAALRPRNDGCCSGQQLAAQC